MRGCWRIRNIRREDKGRTVAQVERNQISGVGDMIGDRGKRREVEGIGRTKEIGCPRTAGGGGEK